MAGKKKAAVPKPLLMEVEGLTLFKFPTKRLPYDSVKLSQKSSETLGFKRRVVRSGHIELYQVYGPGNLSYVKVITLGPDGPRFIVPNSRVSYGKDA